MSNFKWQINPAYNEEVLSLYQSVGWMNYTHSPKMLEKAWQGSLFKCCVYDQDQLIGLIRVVGDGASIIYIQDLLVHPDWQRQKIGTALILKVLQKYQDVYQIVLLTDDIDKNLSFYRHLGFVKASEFKCTAMLYQR